MGARRRRDERGATAVLAALLAVVLFGISAFVIDLGQAWAKKSLLQTNVDLAVMAAVAELDNPGACNAEVITAAEAYLTKAENEVPGQFPAIDLASGGPDDDDGFITCNNWRVDLYAPRSRVDYSTGKLLVAPGDPDHLQVPAHAAAQIKSPGGSSSLPMYAVAGCDTGQQTLSDPPPGPPPAHTPPALSPDGTADIKSLVVTPPDAPTGTVEPYSVTVTGQVRGVAAGTTGQITFTNPDTGDIVPAGSPAALPTGGGWNNFTLSAVTVPQSVLDVTGIWWVRIKVVAGATTDYSPTSEAETFVVGDLLFCNGTVSGNFGTLRIARNDSVNANWLEMNIIRGMQPLMLTNASSAVPCSPVDSDLTPTSPTDCVSTDPGFPNEAATDGLVNGSGSYPGRLDHDTTPGCDRTGGSSRTMSAPALNDDVLTCYIVGASNSVADVVAGVPGILSAEIFSSPRFFQIPILPVEASSGASGAYPIIGFRPGFITEEPLTSTPAARGSVTGHNGVHFQAGHVDQLNVTLFPEAALPETAPPVGGEIDYTGTGTKVLVMVE